MINVKAILLPNTGAENLTAENFYDSQQEVCNPMVVFLDTTTNEAIKFYRIAADTMEVLEFMYKFKYFDTPDLPEETYEKYCEAYFVGVNKEEEVV